MILKMNLEAKRIPILGVISSVQTSSKEGAVIEDESKEKETIIGFTIDMVVIYNSSDKLDNIFKGHYTCQRPVFSLGISQCIK